MKTDSQKLKSRAEYFNAQKNSFKEMAYYLEETIHLIENIRGENYELRKENEILRHKVSGLTTKVLKLEGDISKINI